MLTLADILEALTGTRPSRTSLAISEAAVDSRQVIPGAMFVALPGERVDGHDYVGQAFDRGANLALIQNDLSGQFPSVNISNFPEGLTIPNSPFCLRVDNTLEALQKIAAFWRRKMNVKVIGITGSVGKSTTKEVVAAVLSRHYHTLKNEGNLNNEIGLPLTLLRLGKGHERAVLEMGFYVPGEIKLLCEIAQPSIGVITNIGTVHAERAGSQQEIARGKAELVQSLPANGTAILNYDDPLVRPMAEQTRAQVFYYGLDSAAHLWADNIESMGLEGIRLRLHYQNETLYLRVPLIGRHSVHTVLRAAAVGLSDGLAWAEIISGLKESHMQLRLVAIHTPGGALILDDTYNASPQSTLAALNLLDEMEGKKIAVLGDMLELGQYEALGHRMVGVRAAQVCDELITVGRRGKMIAEAALDSRFAPERVKWFETVPEVITYLQENLTEGDVVLLKGSHSLRMDKIASALEVIQ